jgi:uncharacterized protein (DUF111 family)
MGLSRAGSCDGGSASGREIYSKHASAELVTPTGAAILAAMVDDFRRIDGFSTDRIGYGAGTKQFQNFPNCLRLMIGKESPGAVERTVPTSIDGFSDIMVIEANIDDMTPQNFAYVTERLLEAGALDVCTIPVQMKKGRSGFILQVLSPMNRCDVLSRLIFQETTSIGPPPICREAFGAGTKNGSCRNGAMAAS